MPFQKPLKRKLSDNEKIWIVEIAAILFVLLTAFFNMQMEDEKYYGLYQVDSIPEEVDGDNGIVTVKESYKLPKDTIVARIAPIHIGPGNYTVEVDHQNDVDYEAVIYNGEKELSRFTLPKESLLTFGSFSTDKDLYHFHVDFLYPGKGTVTFKHAYLRAAPFFWSDILAYAAIFILFILYMGYWAQRKRFLSMSDRERLIPYMLFLFTIFMCYPQMNSFVPGGGDSAYCLSRIECTKNELLQGHFPVAIYAEGHDNTGSLGALYPSMFLYIPAVLRIFRVSFTAAFKIFEVCMHLVTMASAWYCGRRLLKNDAVAAFAVFLYGTLSYRIICLYFRDAIGETEALCFIPLVIAGLYDVLIEDKKKWWVLSLGLSGIIGSHVLSGVFAFSVCVIFGLIYIKRIFTEGRFLPILKAAGLTLILSLFTIVPYLYYYKSDINLFGTMASMDFSYAAAFPTQLFMVTRGFGIQSSYGLGHGIINEDSLSVGIVGLIMAAVSLYALIFKKDKDKLDRFGDGMFLVAMFYLFMSTTIFPWATLQKFKLINDVVQMFQFPFRFEQIGQTFLLFSGIIALYRLPILNKFRKPLLIGISIAGIMMAFFLTDSFFQNEHFVFRFEPDIQDEMPHDYIPHGYNESGIVPERIESEAEIEGYTHVDTAISFNYRADKEVSADVPLIFYRGYRAFLSDGRELNVEKGPAGQIRLMLPASSDNLGVRVYYREPLYFTAAAAVSLIFWIAMAGFVVYRHLKNIYEG